ncbi:pilus assembly protein PilP [Yersinia alsatica]|uniref:pilus assembly protein PilP n=1 Tax=Yersinia alsatica TaxID=2890317 RepID=UPI00269D606F
MSNCKGGWFTGLLLMVATQASVVWAEPSLVENGRNPFQQVTAESCDDGRKELVNWQLQGTVRGTNYSSAWVQPPDGGWQMLRAETMLLPHWRVTHIGPRQVSLQYVNPDKPCSGLADAVVLSMR